MILVLVVVLAVTVVMFVSLAWLRAVDSLPAALESRYDIELQFRQKIESERAAFEHKRPASQRRPVTFVTPDFTHMPKELVALHIDDMGCPDFFANASETGWPWRQRLFNSLRGVGGGGNGRCELNLSRHLADRLGAKSTMEVAVAADRAHQFLTKDELVAYDLETINFGEGVVGIHAAARDLMQKELEVLSLAELAELYLVMPTYDLWTDIASCHNASLIRTGRDQLITRLEKAQLVTEDAARAARAENPRCLSVKH